MKKRDGDQDVILRELLCSSWSLLIPEMAQADWAKSEPFALLRSLSLEQRAKDVSEFAPCHLRAFSPIEGTKGLGPHSAHCN
jgi:hypothetical protein